MIGCGLKCIVVVYGGDDLFVSGKRSVMKLGKPDNNLSEAQFNYLIYCARLEQLHKDSFLHTSSL